MSAVTQKNMVLFRRRGVQYMTRRGEMTITDKETIRRFKDLSLRLNKQGFSFQYDDYFLLQDYLPEVIKILEELRNDAN